MKAYAFNVTFTRPDEQDARAYTVGHNVSADTRKEAEQLLALRNAHLTVQNVELFAVMLENGDVVLGDENGEVVVTR